MSSQAFDPACLDVAAFAKQAGELSGSWPLAGFPRLAEVCAAEAWATHGGALAWQARGERRVLRGGQAQVWLHLRAEVSLPLVCQRCLHSVEVAVSFEHPFLFVHGEEEAARLDADSEDDVLALTRTLDLHALIEDEVLLALPLVPRHDTCAQPLRLRDDTNDDTAAVHPFAALAGLRKPGPLN